MGIRVDWDQDVHYVLRYTVTGQWTWAEFYAARDKARGMAESIARQQINCIIDIHDGSPFPPNALIHFHKMPQDAHPKLRFGTVVIVGDSAFLRTLVDIMHHLNPKVMENFHLVPTLADARTVLRQPQMSMASSH